MIAVELGNYHVQTAAGEKRMKGIIADDMRAARERGDHMHVLKLKLCLRHFLERHAGETNR